MDYQEILDWLMQGDPSIAYQTGRDILGDENPVTQHCIANEGWGHEILKRQNNDTSWGEQFYQPKWISTHYTLLQLKNMQLPCGNEQAKSAIKTILTTEKRSDGGVGPGKTVAGSDVCVAGMFLNYAAYFQQRESDLSSVIDFLLTEHMADGGFNCESNHRGAHHSSMHSTLSVLEGFAEYKQQGFRYRLGEVNECLQQAEAFLLQHRLYKSDRTGDIIQKDFLHLAYPARWKYNILRALDYFQWVRAPWDERMRDATTILLAKRKTDGRWMTAAAHAGKQHLIMEQPRTPSRWNTLQALRVLQQYPQALMSI